MDSAIKIDYLLKEELKHELDTLHIPYDSQDSVDVLRKLLRQTRSLVRRGSIKPSPQGFEGDNQQELTTCKRRIEELKTASAGGIGLTEAQRERLVARANYYLGRIARIPDETTAVNELQGCLVSCLSKLNPDVDSSVSEDEDYRSPERPEPRPVCRAEPRINLSSLNLRFKGDTCVRAFITRLNELRQAREIPERVIFNGFPDILDGPALFWYRANKDSFTSYEGLLAALKADFDIPDFDFRLLSEIRARTQARHESIVVFLSVMGGLFSRLTKPMSEEDRLDILVRNIRPEYGRNLALVDINSVAELKAVCMRLELANVRASNFSEPSTSDYTVAPDLELKPCSIPRRQNLNFI